MKMFLASAVCLVLGLGLGWYFEHHRAQREKTEIVQQMLAGSESCDRYAALMATRAIQLIESGQAQQAMQTLAPPVAHYYTVYAAPGTKEERRAETRTLIEQFAKSNQFVVGRIAELTTNSQYRVP
jgi:hypothetical protein